MMPAGSGKYELEVEHPTADGEEERWSTGAVDRRINPGAGGLLRAQPLPRRSLVGLARVLRSTESIVRVDVGG